MGNIFKSLFASKAGKTEEEKKFEIFKYDGLRAMRTGKIAYAIKCFEEALKIEGEKETLSYLISAYLSNHQMDEALETANKLVEADTADELSLLSRATIYFQLGQNDGALADCNRIIETERSNPAVFLLIARIKKTSDIEGAIEALAEVIALKDDIPDAYLLRADILNAKGCLAEALTDVEKLLELAPEEEAVYILKGQICEKAGEMAEATDCYTQALELNPYSEEAAILKARRLAADSPEEAITFIDEILETIPNSARAYTERAKAKRLKGDTEGAAEDEATAAELLPVEEEGTATSDFKDMYKGGLY